MELIDREALKAECYKHYVSPRGGALSLIDEAPAVKAVSVDALYEELDKSEFIYLTKNDVRNIVEGLL